MIPEFELVTEGPENSFLKCRLHLPDEEAFAREIELDRRLERGDVKVEYSASDGRRHVMVYARVVRMIDCSKGPSWTTDAEECPKTGWGFDILNAKTTDISQLNRITRPCADWFRWSGSPEPTPRRKYRPVK